MLSSVLRGAAPLRCTLTHKCLVASPRRLPSHRYAPCGGSSDSRCCAGYQQAPASMLNFTPEEVAQLMGMASEMTPEDRQLFMESLLQLQAEGAAAERGAPEQPWDAPQDDMDQQQGSYGKEVDDNAFWEQPQNNTAMWSVLQQFLGPEEAALVNRLAGQGWAAGGTLDTAHMMQQAADMTPADRERLLGIMSKLQQLQQDVEGGVIDVTDMVQGATAAAGPTSSSGIGPQPAYTWEGPYVTSATSEAAERNSGQASTSGRDSSSSSSSSSSRRRRRAGRGPIFNRKKSSRKAPGLVNSAVRSASAARRGDAVWGCAASQDLITLKQVHEQLTILSNLDEATMEAEGWTPDDVGAAVEFCNEAMVGLMDRVAAAQEQPGGAWDIDDATQSVLLWMDAVMRDPEEGGLEVTHDNLEQLGEVLAAAENLEVVKEYVNSLASIKPQHKQLPQVLEDAGLSSPDWFVPPERQQEALDAVTAATGEGPDGSLPAGGVRASVAGVLRPFVCRERIQMLADLDGDSLRFAVDLQKTRFRQDTFMKWSMHPRIGPMLVEGNWGSGEQLPGLLAWLYAEGGMDVLGLNLPPLAEEAQEVVDSAETSSGGSSSSSSTSDSNGSSGGMGEAAAAAAASTAGQSVTGVL